MDELRHRSPKETLEKEGYPEHSFELIVNGEKIGSATVLYFSKPIPMYQISNLDIEEPLHRGKGYGGKIMGAIEDWLLQRKKPGIIVDAIHENSPAKGMYARRGWEFIEELEGHDATYVYNWPNDVDKSILRGYKQRYTDPRLRASSGKWLADLINRPVDESTEK